MSAQKFLIVDDDDVDRIMIGRCLRKATVAADVSEARTGDEGIELIRSQDFSCILLDYQMPGADGLSILRMVRAEGVRTPIILLTGQGDEFLAVEVMKCGASDYLTKDSLNSQILAKSIEHVTRVRKNEDELLWLASFPELQPSPVLEIGVDGRITYLNPAARSQFPALEASGTAHPLLHGITDIIDELEQSREQCSSRELLVEDRHLHQTVTYLAQRQVARVYASDITELRQAEKALIEAEKRFQKIVESIDKYIYSFDVGPRGELSRPLISPSVARFTGRDHDHHQSDPNLWLEMVHPEDRDSLKARFRELLKGGRTQSYEYRLVDVSGNTHWVVDDVYVTRDDSGQPIEVFGVVSDVTERRRLEDRLQQAQKMESVGTLAGGIAHDFNNILAGILGHASLMKETVVDEHLEECVDSIEISARRAAKLTAQLLAFARGGSYEKQPVNLNRTIQDTLIIISRTFDKIIDVETALNEHLPSTEVDITQIQQVVLNLCVNARDAMPDGGQLTISTDSVAVTPEFRKLNREAHEGDYVVLSVTDTGVGMDPETQQRIFDPFFSTKPEGEGTGLGLSMAYGVVKNHGGFIKVSSKPDAGATFKVFLPASEKAEHRDQSQKRPVQRGDETVLVVDDEKVIRRLVDRALGRHGYQVIQAPDGEHALRILTEREDTIDLVILDMVMPKMGGKEVFLKIRELDPTMKVIISTGHSRDENIRSIFQHNVNGYIQKPYDIPELLSKVRSALDS